MIKIVATSEILKYVDTMVMKRLWDLVKVNDYIQWLKGFEDKGQSHTLYPLSLNLPANFDMVYGSISGQSPKDLVNELETFKTLLEANYSELNRKFGAYKIHQSSYVSDESIMDIIDSMELRAPKKFFSNIKPHIRGNSRARAYLEILLKRARVYLKLVSNLRRHELKVRKTPDHLIIAVTQGRPLINLPQDKLIEELLVKFKSQKDLLIRNGRGKVVFGNLIETRILSLYPNFNLGSEFESRKFRERMYHVKKEWLQNLLSSLKRVPIKTQSKASKMDKSKPRYKDDPFHATGLFYRNYNLLRVLRDKIPKFHYAINFEKEVLRGAANIGDGFTSNYTYRTYLNQPVIGGAIDMLEVLYWLLEANLFNLYFPENSYRKPLMEQKWNSDILKKFNSDDVRCFRDYFKCVLNSNRIDFEYPSEIIESYENQNVVYMLTSNKVKINGKIYSLTSNQAGLISFFLAERGKGNSEIDQRHIGGHSHSKSPVFEDAENEFEFRENPVRDYFQTRIGGKRKPHPVMTKLFKRRKDSSGRVFWSLKY